MARHHGEVGRLVPLGQAGPITGRDEPNEVMYPEFAGQVLKGRGPVQPGAGRSPADRHHQAITHLRSLPDQIGRRTHQDIGGLQGLDTSHEEQADRVLLDAQCRSRSPG